MPTLLVTRRDAMTAEACAGLSAAWGERALGGDAELLVAGVSGEAAIAGAFQRRAEIATAGPVLRRGSGGGAAIVGPGVLWVQLALARPDALVPATADKLVNRYVRPLLRALTRVSGVPASFFGRDWISAAHRPVALVAFAHDGATGRSLVEAFVAVARPVAEARPSFLGKAPATLEGLAGKPVAEARAIDAVADAYRSLPDVVAIEGAPALAPDGGPIDATPWAAVREEAIGRVGAGRDAAGRLRVGGELMASRDAIARLEELVAALPADAGPDAVGAAVDEALGGAVVFGVRSLASIRDAIGEALRTSPGARSTGR